MSKVREISVKGLLHRSNIAASAVGFFAAYTENLAAGKIGEEIDEVVSPFIRKMNEGKLRAGAALVDLRSTLLTLHLESEHKKAVKALHKSIEDANKPPKAYVATVRNEDGQIMTKVNDKGEVVELYQEFEKQTDAERWCIRRLFHDSEVSWHGEVLFTKCLPGIDDTLVISREDAIAEILKPGGRPVMHRTKTSATLSNKMKAKGDHCHFSHG